ncbi:MAG: tRNA (adenosine(37)-N6)-threonylcarbamoyltransferase complex ATPase subunit type 1 TsaE [Bacteroidales bacterium]|nr:tRNA (adenosine(37)-N6)-threonylcarbamoyltransferase complex ATPase subunit type 1 TsaE [Bacteroidales bacterium]
MELICKTIQHLPQIARALLQLYPQQRVFALRGQMGAGKTTFMHAVAQVLGSTDEVSSPTFAIVNQYNLPARDCIYHFDCYRLKNLDDAYNIGFEEYLYSGHYCFIEWAEIVEELLPEDIVNIYITINQDGTERTFSF